MPPEENVQTSSATIAVRFPAETRHFEVELIHSDMEQGYAVSCPALPGCWSQGDSEEQTLTNIVDAIREYVIFNEEQKQRAALLHKAA